MSSVLISLRTTGYFSTDSPSIGVNGVDVAPGRYGQGLNVAVLDQTTGTLISFTNYNTSASSSASDAFAAAIENLPIGRVVALVVQSDAFQNLTDRARIAAQTLGSGLVYQLTYRAGWLLLGQKGAAPGTRREELSAGGPQGTSVNFTLQDANLAGYALKATSAGFSFGSMGEVLFKGVTVPIQGGYSRGMNVVVIDPSTAQVVQTAAFDTYGSSQASDAFAALLEGLAYRQIVVVVVVDEASFYLTERAKLACESVGSGQIRSLGYRGSWSLIGYKGALPGDACESLSNTGRSCCCTALQTAAASANFFTFTVQSSGTNFGNSSAIFVDDTPVLAAASATRGYNIAVLDPFTGVMISRGGFDLPGDASQADAMARFVAVIPTGCPVAVAVRGDGATNLNANARRALASVGAALAGNLQAGHSYSLMGRKGAAPGSVAEMWMTNGSCCASFRFPLASSTDLPFQQVWVYSAGYTVGNNAFFVLNGRQVRMPYGRGLNVVLLARDGTVQLAATYDTCGSTAASDAFAAVIEQAPAGQIVAIAVLDEASNNLTARAKQACQSLGSSSIGQLGYRGSWALVGAKGRAAGTAAEGLCNNGPAFCSSWVSTRVESSAGKWLGVRSAGFDTGNYAAITVNGTAAWRAGWQASRGLNVAVFDEQNGNLLDLQTYDTCGSSAASDAFAAMIEGLPVGRVVAIAVMDEASNALTDRARRAASSVGSTSIWNLGYRNAWGCIGLKGAAPGSALESLQAGPVGLQYWQPYLVHSGLEDAAFGFLFALFVAIFALAVVACILIALAPLPEPPPVINVPRGPRNRRYRAVFVGIDYTQIPGLNLQGAGSLYAGRLFREMVNLGYFLLEDTRLLLESAGPPDLPSKTNILSALDWLVSGAQPGDVLYFHYLGHGGRDSTVSPPSEYLITLNDDLTARSVTPEAELKSHITAVNARANLTLVLHCCFSGDMIDTSASGRGIALASSSSTVPTTLDPNTNMTTLLGKKLGTLASRGLPMITYEQMRQFINDADIKNEPVLSANRTLYDVTTLKYLQPLP